MSYRPKQEKSRKKTKSSDTNEDMIDIGIVKKNEDKETPNNDIVVRCAKNKKILLRKKELFDHLNDNKLEYVKNGICDSYIRYGTPSLDDVINNIQTKLDIKTKRMNMLIKRLKKAGEIFDETVSYYKHYIQYGGDIDYAIDEGIKEWFYINKTNYLELLQIHGDEEKAQTKAFNTYIKHHGPDKYTEKIQKSEICLRLF